MFFFLRLSDTIFSCFLMGFERRSIFYRVHWIKLVWHLVSIFILARALACGLPCSVSGTLRPCTILSEFWFFLF